MTLAFLSVPHILVLAIIANAVKLSLIPLPNRKCFSITKFRKSSAMDCFSKVYSHSIVGRQDRASRNGGLIPRAEPEGAPATGGLRAMLRWK